ncbi:glycoside hydrolase family 76 protein [Dothistroma septosporum NZE10]|uniref:Mannan endo-1,6-alpha-mannosidase n=1 Tax=Dothistroma septosporum (strain NZE10 / CBS 128990) TaxID=675120 RepID=N1PTP5_DOTSN|nr:glycoside hydrolase family 76 protein [Dothistroma septosporum NZE10]
MKFSFGSILAATAAGLQLVNAIDLDPNNVTSIKAAARTLAFALQSYYVNNQTTTPPGMVGTWPGPTWYWWKGGAIWGGMVDYWAYTNDSAWNTVTQQGILAQVGPYYNFEPPAYNGNLGNDDQAFWALAAMSAAEYDFPVAQGQNVTWIDLAKAVFDRQVARWDTATCGGGLRWQVFEANQGWNYKNSISNGGLFQIAARLARYTGNQTYIDWSEKTWEWMSDIGLVSPSYQVFDGSDVLKNCSELDHTQWTYNPAVMIYGTAALANLTDDPIWKNRTEGLLTSIENTYFSVFPNATDIMVESACEPTNNCDDDQLSFKAYLSRWLAKSAVVYPAILPNVQKYLTTTALGVAKACTGNATGDACGQKWYTGGFDGRTGYDQQLTALETVQALLLLNGAAPKMFPDTSDNVTIQVRPVTSTFPLEAPTITAAKPPKASSNGASSSSSLLTRSASSGTRSTDWPNRSPWATLNSWAFGIGLISVIAISVMGMGN